MILKILGIIWVAEKAFMAFVVYWYRKRNRELEEYRGQAD